MATSISPATTKDRPLSKTTTTMTASTPTNGLPVATIVNWSMDKRHAYKKGDADLRLFVRELIPTTTLNSSSTSSSSKKRPIYVKSWCTILEIKYEISKLINIPPSNIKLYFNSVQTTFGIDIPNHRSLHDVGIYRSGETLIMDIVGSANMLSPTASSISRFGNAFSPTAADHLPGICISKCMYECSNKFVRNLVDQTRRGMAVGIKPVLVPDGSGGTYFLHDGRKTKLAVFKPSDEEPYASNNPRGYLPATGGSNNDVATGLRDGIQPGEACIREVAAYLLDHNHMSSVPITTLVEARHTAFHNADGSMLSVAQGGASIGSHALSPMKKKKSTVGTASDISTAALLKKSGSFQEYVDCECTIDDISSSKLSVREVHKIAILDIRLMNADRNAANLLVVRKNHHDSNNNDHTDDELQLVPIDHGYCLRSVCDVSWMDWCWLDWDQLKQPICQEHKEYIQKLDVEADIVMLRDRLSICETALDYFRASTMLLKAGVEAGLTLYDIAVLACRNDDLSEIPSMMENLLDMASELAGVAVDNDRWHHTDVSQALADQLRCRPAAEPAHHRSSLNKSPLRSKDHSFHKAVSSVDLVDSGLQTQDATNHAVSPTKDKENGRSDIAAEAIPGIGQSSVSDTTSSGSVVSDDGGSHNQENCNEWAKRFVSDFELPPTVLRRPSLDMKHVIQQSKSRSDSVSEADSSDSDDAGVSYLSSSPPSSFWTVRPGSSKAMQHTEFPDYRLSPKSSSALVSGLSPPPSIASLSLNGCEDTTENHFDDDDDEVAAVAPLKTPTVTFAEAESFPPQTVSVSNTLDAVSTSAFTLPPLKPTGGMVRSKSYTALTARTSQSSSSHLPGGLSSGRHRRHADVDDINYKRYFHSFIDLVIVRETHAAALRKTTTAN